MVVLIRSKHQLVDDNIRRFVDRCVTGRIARFFDNPAAELLVELVGQPSPHRDLRPQCLLTLFIPGGRTQRIEQGGADVYQAIDLAGERLSRACRRELTRSHERKPHHWRSRSRTAVRFPESMLPPNFATYPLG